MLTWGAVVIAGFAVAGCASSAGAPPPEAPSRAREEEARRLAVQAQRAQREGNADQAVELYRRSLAVSDSQAAVWHNLGALLCQQGRYVDAVEACKRAADLSPTDPRPLIVIGTTYSKTGWEEKALENFTQALARDERSVEALRGAIKSGKLLGIADNASLDRVRTALMTDVGPGAERWRPIYEAERIRIQGELATKDRGK